MNPLKKIKGILPPSSRSFHGLYGEVLRIRDEMRVIRDEMWDIRGEMHENKRQLQNAIEANDVHLQMLAYGLGGDAGESYDATRERFFKKLPKAVGNDRLVQLACLQLMRDFDEFCRTNDLTYWMSDGTLLGAVRHGGFIPWDDDVDLGMLRSDVNKIIQLTANDDRFMITEVFDHIVTCRQVRFRYRDERIPCFLDLFIFDLGTVDPDEAPDLIARDRARLKDALADEGRIAAWNDENPYIDADTTEGVIIKTAFNKLVVEAYGDNGFLTHDPAQAKSVIWAIDNFEGNTGRSHHYEYGTIFPVAELSFEGCPFSAPNDPESALLTLYGDYRSLPKDIATHFTHIDMRAFDDPETKEALGKLASQK